MRFIFRLSVVRQCVLQCLVSTEHWGELLLRSYWSYLHKLNHDFKTASRISAVYHWLTITLVIIHIYGCQTAKAEEIYQGGKYFFIALDFLHYIIFGLFGNLETKNGSEKISTFPMWKKHKTHGVVTTELSLNVTSELIYLYLWLSEWNFTNSLLAVTTSFIF